MKFLGKLSILLILSILLTGCVPKKIIDNINIESAAAFDKLAEDKFIGTLLTQEYLPDKSIKNNTFTSKASLRRDLMLNLQKESSKPIVTGGVLVSIFGDKLVDDGIIEFVDTYQRDPGIGARNFLATSHGSALEILKGDYGPQGNSSYLNDLIEHNIERGDVPVTNLHIFLRDYYMKGKDPYLPEIRQLAPNKVEISGMSMFNGDKEVYILPKKKMFYFKMMVDNHTEGSYRVHLSKGIDADVKSISSKHKYKLSKENPGHVTIELKLVGVIKEYTGSRLTPKAVKKIEKKLEEEIKEECLKLIETFKKENTDPVGFGFLHRKYIRGYDFKNWKDDYQKLTVKINCKVRIAETGVID
ncbi:Ger(x)C family spore germination protein [Bacillus sp. DTU_2020_1000418_1_SI_GHA_SEK_038]|uniref:Ger(x)C family spore germination protein n=1 Tax=Bacillus sp. DTU_2020_1000418_1_SI_GHA_SEK_038 TaxID=3077585 RepID=UPI0028E5C7C8|nr:Ger(x)C family spore germination protein [Bacillus sp. DTU_2020_1000418_1_SI_GHA_SEK_038]WNS74879.1 Ger(x)C family spore germination protein [Bacillus sp. DTU_2020_1000418_1_SI_GHA_SEK_038]